MLLQLIKVVYLKKNNYYFKSLKSMPTIYHKTLNIKKFEVVFI
jgi:hypothetical protein